MIRAKAAVEATGRATVELIGEGLEWLGAAGLWVAGLAGFAWFVAWAGVLLQIPVFEREVGAGLRELDAWWDFSAVLGPVLAWPLELAVGLGGPIVLSYAIWRCGAWLFQASRR